MRANRERGNMPTMSMTRFIEENRAELISHIKFKCDNCETSDEDIEEWIENDEQLFVWATASGVDMNA
jgi:hypothetical protein